MRMVVRSLRRSAYSSLLPSYALSSPRWGSVSKPRARGMVINFWRSKMKKKPAKKRATRHPPIPAGVRPGNRYAQLLGLPLETPPLRPAKRDDTSAGFITGFMVIGFGIFCYTAYKFTELVLASPVVCP